MPQKVVSFKGINRKINEFLADGECEELINLSSDAAGGLRVVRNKCIIIEDVSSQQIVEHSWRDKSHHILVSNGVVIWASDSKDVKQTITDEFKNKSVSLSYSGNVLVVYCKEDKRQLVFKFEDGRYNLFEVSVPRISKASVSYTYNWKQPAKGVAYGEDVSISAMRETMSKAASAFYAAHPNGLCGAVVFGCAYELEDGSELWSTAFTVADATKILSYDKPIVSNGTNVVVHGAEKVTLKLSFSESEASSTRKVNIYATRPVFPYYFEDDGGLSSQHAIVRRSLDTMELDNQVMYFMGSVDAVDGTVEFTPDFGIGQAGSRIMDVLPACISRVGENVSYNSRFHFFNSEVVHTIQPVTASHVYGEAAGEMTTLSYWIAYVKIDKKWKLLEGYYEFEEGKTNDFIYPMAGVTNVAFVKANMTDGVLSVPWNDVVYLKLKDSDAYNYSYIFDASTATVPLSDSLIDEWTESGQNWGGQVDKEMSLRDETNAMNVSAQFNPFVFPVNYSYSFGGEIKDIATSYLPISSTQVGQYPLTVFTSNGIYALEQGSGAVLYGNITPIQPLVISGKAESTPSGIFFASSNRLYCLSGRETTDVSKAISGKIDYDVRRANAFQSLITYTTDGKNMQYHISDMEFDQLMNGAVLTYDQLNNEVYISAKRVPYSYAFNIDTGAYHKVTRKYLQSPNNARYVIEESGTNANVVDMHSEILSEKHQGVLLQTRPMALSALYSHIDRAVIFADADLTQEGQYLMLSVFASDNLSDWKCIISAQKKDTVLSHIRTNRAAKSYKYYVFLVNGVVGTDTDLSSMIIDYSAVSRRLG